MVEQTLCGFLSLCCLLPSLNHQDTRSAGIPNWGTWNPDLSSPTFCNALFPFKHMLTLSLLAFHSILRSTALYHISIIQWDGPFDYSSFAHWGRRIGLDELRYHRLRKLTCVQSNSFHLTYQYIASIHNWPALPVSQEQKVTIPPLFTSLYLLLLCIHLVYQKQESHHYLHSNQ